MKKENQRVKRERRIKYWGCKDKERKKERKNTLGKRKKRCRCVSWLKKERKNFQVW